MQMFLAGAGNAAVIVVPQPCLDRVRGYRGSRQEINQGSQVPECFFLNTFFFFFFLLLAVLGLYCCVVFSLVVASGGYSPLVVRGLLTVVASLIAEHGLWGARASVLMMWPQ